MKPAARSTSTLLLGWLAAGALIGCDSGVSGADAQEPPGLETVEMQMPIAATEISPRDLSRQFSSSAQVEPYARVRLAGRAAGNVSEVRVEAGDAVRAGESLARIDTSEQAAELARIEAQLEHAQRHYDRSATLHRDGMLSATEYEVVRLDLQVTQREYELWRTRVEFGEVVAPIDAVVTARYVEPGEGVQAQDVLFELVSMDLLVVRLGVSELDVVHLEPGQPVPVVFDAITDGPLEGQIRRIFPVADDDTRLVTVEVALPEDAARRGVRPGFLARVRMPIDPRPDVIAAPSTAIGENGDGTYFVFVVRDDRLERRRIEPGARRGDWTEIRTGLEAGEVVLATSPDDFSEGQAVRIVGWRG